jgi:hypothetical protein
MLKSTIIGAAALLSVAITAPAFAEVIQEPGAYAFYHPNSDLGLGASRPADAMASQPVRGGDLGGMRMSVRTHRAIRASTIKHE